MKRNFLKIETNNVNVYLTFTPNPPLVLKLILITFCLIVFTAPVFIIINVEESEIGKFILGMSIYYLLMFLSLGRYTLWNIFGEERLIVSTRSISHQHHYGFFDTNLKTQKFDTIYIQFQKTNTVNDIDYGKIEFYSQDENGILTILYETTIIVSEDKIKESINDIEKLFYLETISVFGQIHNN
ncbi:hypothetical protein IFO69_13160 [Echinicola sp. CAU 1574]|uniref:Photosystem I assembly protein Ycf4 n=1 Tax=Echinicola arenosa TaxID=2774144 RepID=A0ABR9AMD6_9BACT|nr:hypothetical protein [Echinicola arenosa]MBD8489699.1 hypothetical protein [Echinicola arenosa]